MARIVLQDFTGVPLLCDLAAMRGVAHKMGKDPKVIEPLVPVDLVVDHSVQIDHFGNKNALDLNMKLEFKRNEERYQFMKWGMQAFDTFKVVPPGIGIVHQVNLEYLARGVHKSKDGVCYPGHAGRHRQPHHHDQRHRRGRLGLRRHRGRGRHARPAGLLPHARRGRREPQGQAASHASPPPTWSSPSPRCCARRRWSASSSSSSAKAPTSLTVTDRATIANMAPEYGATMGFFPVDDKTIEYFRGTGRTDAEIDAFAAYYKAQGMYGIPKKGEIDYSQTLELDLSSDLSRRSPARSARRTASTWTR